MFNDRSHYASLENSSTMKQIGVKGTKKTTKKLKQVPRVFEKKLISRQIQRVTA